MEDDRKFWPAKAKAAWPYEWPQVVPGSPFQARKADGDEWVNGVAPLNPPITLPEDVRFEHEGKDITLLEFDHDGHQIRVHVAFVAGLALEFPMTLHVDTPRRTSVLTNCEADHG